MFTVRIQAPLRRRRPRHSWPPSLYGVTQEGSLGTVGLISAALGLFLLAGVNLYIRDADVSAMDTGALTAVGGRGAGPRAPACGRSSPPSAASSSSSGSSPTRSCSSSGSSC